MDGNGTCTLSVSDTGVGIPEDEIQDVFRRFFRSSNVRADAIQGTGLGLSIVRSIVEQHHGQIDVHSNAGRGHDVHHHPPLVGRAHARLTADTTARRDAVTMLGSSPTPHRISPPTTHSTYAAAIASPPEDSACSL